MANDINASRPSVGELVFRNVRLTLACVIVFAAVTYIAATLLVLCYDVIAAPGLSPDIRGLVVLGVRLPPAHLAGVYFGVRMWLVEFAMYAGVAIAQAVFIVQHLARQGEAEAGR